MNTNVITAIQVLPTILEEDGVNVLPQYAGPTDKTTGWAVYTRIDSRTALWKADTADEESAMIIGRAMAKEFNVEIEAQPWKQQPVASTELNFADSQVQVVEVGQPTDEVSVGEYDHPLFENFSVAVEANFLGQTAGEHKGPVFKANIPKGALFDAYLAAFPEHLRQHYKCDCCRSFLNRFGNLVKISNDPTEQGKVRSVLWNFGGGGPSIDPVFEASVKAMQKLVEGVGVRNVFLSSEEKFGIPEAGGFSHFSVINPDIFAHELKQAHEVSAEAQMSFGSLSKFVNTTSQDLLDNVLIYFINDVRLSKAESDLNNLKWLVKFKRERDALNGNAAKANFTWLNVAKNGMGRNRIHNGPVGKFIKNVAGGDTYEVAAKKYLEMIDPMNRGRAKAPPKAGAVKRADVIFEQMGLAPSLDRRLLTHEDIEGKGITIWQPPVKEAEVKKPASLFGHLETKTPSNEPNIPELPVINGGVLTWKRFVAEVLPTAERVQMAVNEYTMYPFCGFTIAVDPEARPILKWDTEENRNSIAGYMHHGGSAPSTWSLKGPLINIVKIVTAPSSWGNKEDATPNLVFDHGVDIALNITPVFGPALRPELHEVRAVMEAFFKSKPLTPLVEGQVPVTGMIINTDGQIGAELLVTKADAKVKYLIDRSH